MTPWKKQPARKWVLSIIFCGLKHMAYVLSIQNKMFTIMQKKPHCCLLIYFSLIRIGEQPNSLGRRRINSVWVFVMLLWFWEGTTAGTASKPAHTSHNNSLNNKHAESI